MSLVRQRRRVKVRRDRGGLAGASPPALEAAIARTVILHADDLTVRHWAETRAARQRLGRRIGSEDCWIAATALRHGLTLLTHNALDYSGIPNLRIVSHS
jgi:predicted nucleic acid-binding protein